MSSTPDPPHPGLSPPSPAELHRPRRFLIGREKPGEQSEVAQLIQQTLEQERWQREMIEQRYTQYTEDDEEVRGTAPTQEGTDAVPPPDMGPVTQFP